MNRSETIEKLAEALAQAQGQIESAQKGGQNPHFKTVYATLADVWKACRAPLSRYGLSVVQTTRPGEAGSVVLETTLLHTSGQWIAGELHVGCDVKNAQSIGSAITYARRYGLAAICGVCPEDDDGEAAVQAQRQGVRPRERDRGRPAAPSVHDDGPQAALDPANMVKITKRFETRLNGFCERINGAWLDRHTGPDGEVADWVTTLVNPFQLVGHTLKVAGVELPKGGQFRERMRAAAKLWVADEAGTLGEWRRYVKTLADAAEQDHGGNPEPVGAANGARREREPGEDG